MLARSLTTLAIFLMVFTVVGLIGGISISLLWNWYVVPLGAKAIGPIQAIGLSYVGFLVTGARAQASGDKDGTQTIVGSLLTYILALLFGWFWHFFL